MVAYGVLMAWFCQLYRKRILYAAGFILMGVVLEVIQGQLGYRSYEVLDMVANTLGVLLGWGVALLVLVIAGGALVASLQGVFAVVALGMVVYGALTLWFVSRAEWSKQND